MDYTRIRLTQSGTIRYQKEGKEPSPGISLTGQHFYFTHSDVLDREMRIGPDWEEVDFAWAKNPQLLLLQNLFPVENTAKTSEWEDDRAILVGVGSAEATFNVVSGDVLKLPLAAIPKLFLRCVGGHGEVRLVVIGE